MNERPWRLTWLDIGTRRKHVRRYVHLGAADRMRRRLLAVPARFAEVRLQNVSTELPEKVTCSA